MKLVARLARLGLRLSGPALLALVLGAGSAARAAEDLPARAVALLKERCTDCHDEGGSADLSLLTREGALKGGAHGPAVVPGKADESLLVKAVRRQLKKPMPPDEPLAADEVDLLRRWIDGGAVWAAGPSAAPAPPRWWAFRKPQRPALPPLTDRWVRTPIDAFVLTAMKAHGLTPAPEVDRRTFIRRVTLDLHGLAPTADEVKAFESDRAPDAYEKLVDRLLASPRYGEKWGRHWLDLVRYGDTAGFETDPYLLYAWRYRDYVVKSFNDDKPYDRFVKEQIAGDELFPEEPSAQAGTGYFTVGPNRDMQFKVEDINRVETLTDFVDTTGGVFLGLTIGCARCHDHKFDPITQKDYYRLQAIFEPIVKTRVFLQYNAARSYDLGENTRHFKMAELARRLKAAQRAKDEAAIDAIKDELLSLLPPSDLGPFAPGVTDVGREAPLTFIPARGGGVQGEPIRAGFPKILGGGEIPPPPKEATSTGRRKALALWLASPDNPLTARVIVNRIWHFHFGRGLVATPSDFGTRSGKPSHPELLDWMATEMIARGWSWKAMHRLILLSSVYRQSTTASPKSLQTDPENVYLAHMNRRRLTAEEIRDAVLEASGALNLEMGGPPVVPPLAAEELFGMSMSPKNAWYVSADPAQHGRRTLYMLQKRTFRQPMLEVFDGPDGVLSCPRREASTTATQSLSLLNSRFVLDQAKRFAETVSAGAGAGAPVDRLAAAAFRQALGRAPTAAELTHARAFLAAQERTLGGRPAALAELGRALFNLNEFLYAD